MRVYRAILRKVTRVLPARKSATVRFAFPAVLLFSALVGAALTISSEKSYVRIETNPRDVVAGNDFVINIYASAKVPTNAVDITVEYPESQIQILGIDKGESVITIWTEEPYAKSGNIHLRGGVFRKGFLGEHLIARVNARAVESGVAHILTSRTEFLAGDGKGTVVAVSKTGAEKADVQISESGEIKSDIQIGIVTDINGDGEVDMTDIKAFLSSWNSGRKDFDFNKDGSMNFRDFGILLAHSFLK